jgi:uncharacterized protein (TIGR02147 family)
MNKPVFLFDRYKDYVIFRLDKTGPEGRGGRARLARKIRCQTAFVSQVLKGNSDFSLEQCEEINSFFSHSEAESAYFLSLVQHCRAGSHNLKLRIAKTLQKIKEQQMSVTERVEAKSFLSESEEAIYYSSWIYAMIHALASIEKYQNVRSIASRLDISEMVVSDAVDFLISASLLENRNGRLSVGKAQIHLKGFSPHVGTHHANWRIRTLQCIQEKKSSPDKALNYTSIISLSVKDAELVREILLDSIQRIKAIVRDSPSETVASFCIDLIEP